MSKDNFFLELMKFVSLTSVVALFLYACGGEYEDKVYTSTSTSTSTTSNTSTDTAGGSSPPDMTFPTNY